MARPPGKKELIERHPRDMPLKELQRIVRAAGLGSVSKSYAQKVRSDMGREERRAARLKRTMTASATNGNGHAPEEVSFGEPPTLQPGLPASDTELRFFSMLVQIGTVRAQQLLKAYEGL